MNGPETGEVGSANFGVQIAVKRRDQSGFRRDCVRPTTLDICFAAIS